MKFSGLVATVASALLLASCAVDDAPESSTSAVGSAPDDRAARDSQGPAPTRSAAEASGTGNSGNSGDSADPADAEDAGDAEGSGEEGAAASDALATLASLEVKGRAPKTGYARDQFGQRWKDIDRNGCDQRNDVLARDMTHVVREGPCKVTSGTLADPFTATTISFVRGQGTSEAVHIDHLVALSDAWQKGAQQLSPERREQLANDHRNLLAVDGPANQQKSDGDAATWLPANKAFRCDYVSHQVDVKAEYDLWVTAAERDAIARVLGGCGAGELDPVAEVPAPAAVPEPEPEPVPAPAPEPAAPAVPAAPAGDGAPYYANCTAARAAGAAPLYRGAPGYRAQMDRDGDGVACE